MRLYYSCYYDGNKCHKVIPYIDEKGDIIEESHEKIQAKYGNIRSKESIENSWDVCDNCKRNFSISGGCHGILKIEY